MFQKIPEPKHYQTGQTISLIIGGIVVLALLTVTIVTVTRVQIVTGHLPYINQVRSRLLAEHGIGVVLEKFKTQPEEFFITETLPAWLYWGEDLNQNHQLDKGEDQNQNGYLDTAGCPIGLALSPSYKQGEFIAGRVPAGSTYGLKKGCKIAYSGKVNRPTKEIDFYTLKIIDCSSQIYVNGTDTGTRQLLNNLGEILAVDDQLGERIIAYRDTRLNGDFTVKEQLKPCLGEKIYARLKSYLTIYAKPNPKMIKPRPLTERSEHLGVGLNIERMAELNPGPLELEPRAPININTAAKPVLMAVLRNLEGFYLAETDLINPTFQGAIDQPPAEMTDLKIGRLTSVTISPAMAKAITNEIIKARRIRPFLSWNQFNEFCDRLMKNDLLGPSIVNREKALARRDLVKSNANPNTLLNDFNPNKLIHQLVDKSDLSVYTTEFCFQPQGCFEIESVGLVTFIPAHQVTPELTSSAEVDLLGACRIRAVVRLFEPYYETSQQDFARGMISSSGKSDATHNNRSLQTYPEPDIESYTQKAVADGQIMLATLENRSRNKENNDLLTFQHHFRKSFQADYAKGKPELVTKSQILSLFDRDGRGSLYPDGVYSESLTTPAYDAENNFIDGPAHEKLFGINRFRGTISFWMKPNYSGRSTKPHVLLSLTKPLTTRRDQTLGYRVSQDVFGLFLLPPDYAEPRWDRFRLGPPAEAKVLKILWFWNPGSGLGNTPPEYVFMNALKEGIERQWVHIGLAWDTNPPTKQWSHDCPNCQGRGKIKLGESETLCPRCGGRGTIVDFEISASDIFTFCINGQDTSRYIGGELEKYPPQIARYSELARKNLIRLGEQTSFPFWNTSADATIDEVTIQLHKNTQAAKDFIIREYKRGRYYKGGGVFTSGAIDIPILSETVSPEKKAPAALKARATWSVYYPPGWDTTHRAVSIQFFDEKGNPVSAMLNSSAGSSFEIPSYGRKPNIPTRIKYKVCFKDNRDDTVSPFLETPIWDDITITFIYPEAKPLEWYVLP